MMCGKDKNNRRSVVHIVPNYLFNSILFLGFSVMES